MRAQPRRSAFGAQRSQIGGTLGERYFNEQRKLEIGLIDVGHVLRWHRGCNAIIGLMTDTQSGEPLGVHRTFLNADGSKIERKMLGRQGILRLSPNDAVTMSLGLAEGIEDAIAVLLSGWWPLWAATSAGAVPSSRSFPVSSRSPFLQMRMPRACKRQRCAAIAGVLLVVRSLSRPR
jgi:putative DNA primase/helicase